MTLVALLVSAVAQKSQALEVRVDGPGLMRFVRSGRAIYAKSANLVVRDGKVTTSEGYSLLPAIAVPRADDKLAISLDGTLSVQRSGKAMAIGRIVLGLFGDENGLSQDGAYWIAKDRPQLVDPGSEVSGVTRNGEIEIPKEPAKAESKAPKPMLPVIAPYQASQMGIAATPKPKKVELPVIVVKTQAEAAGDKFYLGDIAVVTADDDLCPALQEIPIGESPVIGVTRGIDQASVVAALSRGGFKTGGYILNFPSVCRLKRKCQEVPDAKFEAAAREAIATQFKVTAALKNEVVQPAMSLPMGEVSLKPEMTNHLGRGFTVAIGVFVDGKRINARLVQMGPDRDAVSVTSGQSVKVYVLLNGAKVETQGKAKENGFAGQEISIETSSGALLRGVVSPKGEIEVRL